MRKITLLLIIILFIFLSSCSFNYRKQNQGTEIPWENIYDTYEEMLLDYQKFNDEYEKIYMNPFIDLNPQKYIISGRCGCKEKRNDNHKNEKCSNMVDSLPGIMVNKEISKNDKAYSISYVMNFYEKIEIEDTTKIEKNDTFSNCYKYDNLFSLSSINPNYYIYYEDKIIFSFHFYSFDCKEEIIDSVMDHINNYYI